MLEMRIGIEVFLIVEGGDGLGKGRSGRVFSGLDTVEILFSCDPIPPFLPFLCLSSLPHFIPPTPNRKPPTPFFPTISHPVTLTLLPQPPSSNYSSKDILNPKTKCISTFRSF